MHILGVILRRSSRSNNTSSSTTISRSSGSSVSSSRSSSRSSGSRSSSSSSSSSFDGVGYDCYNYMCPGWLQKVEKCPELQCAGETRHLIHKTYSRIRHWIIMLFVRLNLAGTSKPKPNGLNLNARCRWIVGSRSRCMISSGVGAGADA